VKNSSIVLLSVLIAAVAGFEPIGAASTVRSTLFTTRHPAMGTEFTLYLYSTSSTEASEISAEVFDEIDRVEQLLSNYRDSSELSRINQNAAQGPVTTDPEMMEFLRESQHWSSVSDGAFDITVGQLMKAWGFYRHAGRVPTENDLNGLRAATGWQKVELDLEARTVRFTSPGIELDPGGIGKGFAVDSVVRILHADHVAAAMISAGGSTIYALGAPPHRVGWRVVVPGSDATKSALSVIELRDTSLSSADCSVKNFTADGHLYCHIMNTRTMRPVEGRVRVSIVNPSATASDALSNVIFVEAPEESLATLRRFAPESRALIVSGSAQEPVCFTFRWSGQVRLPHCASR